jgi:hypothetical protein
MAEDTTDTKQAAESQPAPVPQVDELRAQIAKAIKHYRKKRRRNKIGAILVQTLSVALTFGTTVAIGIKLNGDEPPTDCQVNTALILSAMSAGIVTLDKFFDYKDLWIRYGGAISAFTSLQRKIELAARAKGGITEAKLEELLEKYESTITDLDKAYQQIRSDEE